MASEEDLKRYRSLVLQEVMARLERSNRELLMTGRSDAAEVVRDLADEIGGWYGAAWDDRPADPADVRRAWWEDGNLYIEGCATKAGDPDPAARVWTDGYWAAYGPYGDEVFEPKDGNAPTEAEARLAAIEAVRASGLWPPFKVEDNSGS